MMSVGAFLINATTIKMAKFLALHNNVVIVSRRVLELEFGDVEFSASEGNVEIRGPYKVSALISGEIGI